MLNIYFLIVVAYFAAIILLSVFTRKVASRSVADYLVAGRNLGVSFCAVVVAAEWLGGMSTIGVSEKAFTTQSFQPILYNVSTAIGMIIIGFTVASIYRRQNVHTVSEMIDHLFGNDAKKISAIAFLVAYITLAYVQMQTAASVLSAIFGISWLSAILISAVIITFYTYLGGMHALALTSIVHTVMMFLGIGIATVIGMSKIGGFGELQEILGKQGAGNIYNPFGAGLSGAFSLLLGGILGGMAAQASIQPIFAAKDARTAKKASVASAFLIAPFGIMTALLGLIGATGIFIAKTTNPKLVLTSLLTNPEFIHPVFGGLALAGILAAILSTVGPVNFAVVTIATKDIYSGFINPQADEKKVIKVARRMVVIVTLFTLPLAMLFQKGILDAAYVSYAIRSIGAIVILLGIYKRNWINALGVKMAFIGGTAAIFICMLADQMNWFHVDKTYGAVVFGIIFIILGKLIKPEAS
ncbi:MAG TPA: sodium:solute symporter family protein [Bacteroidales bacterium]|nr:sodium:solute symporter family protein [Bacteroidales bacterium]